MDFDEKPKLIFTNVVMMSAFYESSIIQSYNDLKNRLIKRNRDRIYSPVEVSPLSQIYKSNWLKIKENWTKDLWEEQIGKVYRNNIDGEYVFQYKATFEMSYYDDKENYSSYVYEKDLLYELETDYGGFFGNGSDDLGDDEPYDGIWWHGVPKPKEDKHRELVYRLKYKKWLKERYPEDDYRISLAGLAMPDSPGATEDEVLFQEVEDKVILTEEEIQEHIKKVKEERDKEYEKSSKEVINSWKE